MKGFIRLISLASLAVSCVPDGMVQVGNETGHRNDGSLYHDEIVLGDKLEDPYSVANMTKALASIYPTKADRVHVEPTDMYVRFLPADDGDLEMLESLGVQLIDHPVDYEIIKDGDWYHDPEIEEGCITWQYAVVPKGFVTPPGLRWELLENCYIPDNDRRATKADWVDWDEVEREAYRVSGNADMLKIPTKAGEAVPEGKIQIVDDFSGETVGVSGVRVSCHSFVKFSHAFTDADGYYKMERSFPSDVRYRLVFKNRKGFGIGLNLLLQPASCSALGKGPSSGLNVLVDKNSDHRLFARSVVNNAGYDYYEDCESGQGKMTLPPSNLRIWLFYHLSRSSAIMLQQGAFIEDSKLYEYLGEGTTLLEMFLPDITLGVKGLNDYASIYSAATHELAHTSHFMQVGVDYWNRYSDFVISSFIKSGFIPYGVGTEKNHGYCEVGEMWAFYYQTVAFRQRYGTDHVFGTGYWFSPQIFIQLDERGLDRYKIFNALTPDVTNIEMLQSRLQSLYPENRSLINQMFGRY